MRPLGVHTLSLRPEAPVSAPFWQMHDCERCHLLAVQGRRGATQVQGPLQRTRWLSQSPILEVFLKPTSCCGFYTQPTPAGTPALPALTTFSFIHLPVSHGASPLCQAAGLALGRRAEQDRLTLPILPLVSLRRQTLYVFFICIYLASSCGLWDLCSLNRDWTPGSWE